MAETTTEPKKQKDLWDKLQIVFHPLNGLLTAATVALLGYYTSNVLRQNDAASTKERVYTELVSSREQAESSLRKDMFTSIINTFLRQEASIEERMLNLELLTLNFHESLNLKPLFSHMKRQVNDVPNKAARDEYELRLGEIAREIATRQLVLLEQVGQKFSRTVDFDALKASGGYLDLMVEKLVLGGTEREFSLAVTKYEPITREIDMEMGVRTPRESSNMQLRKFSVGLFDFPMIDNTRLSRDQRAAVVVTNSNESSAEITLVYFPGSYASMKEKVSYDEVVEQFRGIEPQPRD